MGGQPPPLEDPLEGDPWLWGGYAPPSPLGALGMGLVGLGKGNEALLCMGALTPKAPHHSSSDGTRKTCKASLIAPLKRLKRWVPLVGGQGFVGHPRPKAPKGDGGA